jgi:hypothetical protein
MFAETGSPLLDRILPRPNNEPVSLTLSLLAAAELGSLTVLGIGMGQVLTGAALIGINAASNALQQAEAKKRARQAAAAASALANEQAALRLMSAGGSIPRQLVLGRVLKAGHLIDRFQRGPYLYYVLALASHEIDGVEEFRVGEKIVPLDANGLPTAAPFFRDGKYYLQVSIRKGTADQLIDPILSKDIPTLDASYRQQGIAVAVVKCFRGETAADVEAVWGQNEPNFLFKVRGAKSFDSRDSAHVLGVPSTYSFSTNWARNFYCWFTHSDFGKQSWDDVDLVAYRTACDDADRLSPKADGAFEPLYSCSGVISSASDPYSIFTDLLLAGLGTHTVVQGRSYLLAGVPRIPVKTLTERTERGEFEISTERPWRDHINTVRVNMVMADKEYEVGPAPVYRDENLFAADGEERPMSAELTFVDSITQAQRIAKHLIALSQMSKSVVRGEDVEAIRLMPSNVVRLYYRGSRGAVANDNYQVESRSDRDRPDEFNLVLRQYDAVRLYGWNPAVDARPWSGQSEAA